MKALTLTQPWATLVAIGAKRIETRSWSTKYRGPIAIHSAAKLPRECRDLMLREPFKTVLRNAGLEDGPIWTGAILAICDLISCERTEEIACGIDSIEYNFGDYSDGRWGFRLANIRPVRPPISAKGMLGFWEWPVSMEEIARFL